MTPESVIRAQVPDEDPLDDHTFEELGYLFEPDWWPPSP